MPTPWTNGATAALLLRSPVGLRRITLAACVVTSIPLGLLVVADPMSSLSVVSLLLVTVLSLLAPLATVAAYFVLVYFQDLLLNFFPDPSIGYTLIKRMDECLLCVLLVSTLTRLALQRIRPRFSSAYLWLALALLCGVPPTLYFGHEPVLAGIDAFLLVKGFLVFFIVSHLPLDARHTDVICRWLTGFAIVALGAAALDFMMGPGYRTLIHHARPLHARHGIQSTIAVFGHEGAAGWFFAFCACLALAVYIVRRQGVYLVLCAASSAGALLTLRRKPMAGLLLVFAWATLFHSGRRSFLRMTATIALMVGAAALVLGDVIGAIFRDMFDLYVYNPNALAVARNAMHVGAFHIAVDYFPFGAGFGQYGGWVAALYYSPLYHEYGLATVYGLSEHQPAFLQDAFWPHVLGELGFFGLVLFVFALCAAFKAPPSACASDSTRVLALATVFVFLEALAESFGWVVFENTLASSFLFGLAGASLAILRQHATPAPSAATG